MSSKIESNALTFNDIFGARTYYNMPVFQRNYVWGKDNIERFLEDLSEIDLSKESDRHFLGPVIVTQKHAGGAARYGECWVIDGQQRLTTTYLALIAMAEISSNLPDFFKNVLRYVFHETTNSRLRPLLVTGVDDSSQLRHVFSSLPEDVFGRIDMSVREGDDVGKLYDAYKRIKSYLQKQVKLATDPIKDSTSPDGQKIKKADLDVAVASATEKSWRLTSLPFWSACSSSILS